MKGKKKVISVEMLYLTYFMASFRSISFFNGEDES